MTVTNKRLAQDVIKYLLSYLIPAIINFLALLFYTRFLTPEEYGDYILVITTVNLISICCLQWLWLSGYRYYQQYKEETFPKFAATLFLTNLLLTAILIIIWLGVVVVFSKWIAIKLLLLGGGLLVFQSFLSLFLHLLRSGFQSLRYSIYTSLTALGSVILSLFFICKFKFGPVGILLGSILGSGSIALWEFRRWSQYMKLRDFSLKILRKFFYYGFPLAWTYLADIILAVSDRYMIKYFISSAAVGVYSAGYILANNILSNIFLVFSMAIHPFVIVAFERSDIQGMKKLMRKAALSYVVFLIPLTFGISYLAKLITQVFFGPRFSQAYQFIPWVAIGILCLGITKHYIIWVFQLKEKTSFILYIFTISALVNVILNFFWVPRFGPLGAAYSTLLSYIIVLILSVILAQRLMEISWPWWSVGKVLIASLMMIITLFSLSRLPTNAFFILTRVIIGASIYFVVLFILKEEFLIQLLNVKSLSHPLER